MRYFKTFPINLIFLLMAASTFAEDFKTWNANKYKTFTKAILEKKIPLPVAGSKESGALFDELVNMKNLTFLKSKEISMHTRLKDGDEINKQVFYLMKFYVKTYNEQKRRDLNLSVTRMNVFYVESYLAGLSALASFIKDKKSNNPQNTKKYIDGFKVKLKNICDNCIRECKRHSYTDESRLVMARMWEKNVKRLSFFYSDEEKLNLRKELENLSLASLNSELEETFKRAALKLN